MKRVLPLVILETLIELSLFLWFSINLFKERTTQLPISTEYSVEYNQNMKEYLLSLEINNRLISCYVSQETLNEFKKSGKITYHNYLYNDARCVCSIILFIVWSVFLIFHNALKYAHLNDSWSSYQERFYENSEYPLIFGSLRNKIYNTIDSYDLTPIKTKFYNF